LVQLGTGQMVSNLDSDTFWQSVIGSRVIPRLRPARKQQKISGRLRSGQATRHRDAIRGYIDTARKHGIRVLSAIRDALAGDPWMPPIPDSP
jgi:hypothetical protein